MLHGFGKILATFFGIYTRNDMKMLIGNRDQFWTGDPGHKRADPLLAAFADLIPLLLSILILQKGTGV